MTQSPAPDDQIRQMISLKVYSALKSTGVKIICAKLKYEQNKQSLIEISRLVYGMDIPYDGAIFLVTITDMDSLVVTILTSPCNLPEGPDKVVDQVTNGVPFRITIEFVPPQRCGQTIDLENL